LDCAVFAFSMREFMLASDTLVREECSPFHEVMKICRAQETFPQLGNVDRA